MEFYQRFGEALSWEEVDEIYEELKDRFGAPPEPTLWLYQLSRLRVFANSHGFSLVKLEREGARLELQAKKGPLVRQVTLPFPQEPESWSAAILTAMVEMAEKAAF